MTAFGFGEYSAGGATYRSEVKSLNSRFLEASVRMPRALQALEPEILAFVKSRLSRGKVDITIDIATARDGGSALPKLDELALGHYIKALETAIALAAAMPNAPVFAQPSMIDLFRLEGVFRPASGETSLSLSYSSIHKAGVFQALEGGLHQLIESRGREGSALTLALTKFVEDLSRDRQWLAQRADEFVKSAYESHKKRLQSLMERLTEPARTLTLQLPEERLLQELIILSDKSDVSEELTRLEAHLTEFLKSLSEGGEVGRRLDFLCQELHREINTLGNKLVVSDVQQVILSMKQNIERLRQQVQNVE